MAERHRHNEVLRRAREVASFGGPMRSNLLSMLDGIGLHEHLGINTTASLFDEHAHLLHSTSAVLYPTFVDGTNYTGSPAPESRSLLQAFVDQVLAAELALLPDAVVVPLGKTVARIVRRKADLGVVREDRCLFEFPHPSPANGHRARLYAQHRQDMATQVAAWTS